MRLHWLLLSLTSALLFSSPAEAAKLLFWRFENNQNRLVFTTDEGVQPKAQLIPNPTRVVIDLPGTTLDQPTVNQRIGDKITSLRIGQFSADTTRLVIELAPGYTLDPQQIRVRGQSPTQWFVELPTPQRVEVSQPTSPSLPSPNSPTPSTSTPPPVTANPPEDNALSDLFQVTSNGFFLRLNDKPANIESRRRRDRREVTIDLEEVSFPSTLLNQSLAVNRYGVREVSFSQRGDSARLTLAVTPDSPNWRASYSRFGGLVIIPDGPLPVSSQTPPPNSPSRPIVTTPTNRIAEIERVELSGTQLIIRGNRSVRATRNWEDNVYRITIPNARLARDFEGPELTSGSPVSQLRVQEAEKDQVVILLQPASNYQVGELNQPSNQLLALELRRSQVTTPSISNIPVPRPPQPTPSVTPPIAPVPNTGVLVIVDPGHGGKDPGAIGINGLRETDINLPIAQQVAAILQQQGVQARLTRSNDTFISLQGRVDMANRAGADLFVSIHANAINMSRPDVNGLETYYYSSGQRLARTIHSNVLRNVTIRDRGVRQARFYVLRKSAMPAVLVEVGFVTGREDAPRLSTSAYRQQMAQAIASGILQYIRENRS